MSSSSAPTRKLALGRPLLVISCISACISIAILALSMLDLGVPYFYLNPILSGLSILFQLTVLMLRRRHFLQCKEIQSHATRPVACPPPHSLACEAGAYTLAFTWLGPLAISIVASIPGGPLDSTLTKHIREGSIGTLLAQGALAVVNFVLMGAIATLLSIERRRYDRSRDSALFKEFTIE